MTIVGKNFMIFWSLFKTTANVLIEENSIIWRIKKNFSENASTAEKIRIRVYLKISFGAETSSKGLQEKKFQISAKFKNTLSYKFEGVPKFGN